MTMLPVEEASALITGTIEPLGEEDVKLAEASGRAIAPASGIVIRAFGLCLCAVLAAGVFIGIVRLAGWVQIAGDTALALKAVSGAVLGIVVARLALRPLSRPGLS